VAQIWETGQQNKNIWKRYFLGFGIDPKFVRNSKASMSQSLFAEWSMESWKPGVSIVMAACPPLAFGGAPLRGFGPAALCTQFPEAFN
jgi:hypothetical protein